MCSRAWLHQAHASVPSHGQGSQPSADLHARARRDAAAAIPHAHAHAILADTHGHVDGNDDGFVGTGCILPPLQCRFVPSGLFRF
jgi:hypothetical protein